MNTIYYLKLIRICYALKSFQRASNCHIKFEEDHLSFDHTLLDIFRIETSYFASQLQLSRVRISYR